MPVNPLTDLASSAVTPVAVTGVARTYVTPEVSSSPEATTLYGDATSGDPEYFRITVNAGDDIVAGSRLKNAYPDIAMLNPGDEKVIFSSAPITRVDVVLVGDHEDTADFSVTEASTEANFRAAMRTYEFASTDGVRQVVITASEILDAKQVRLQINGAGDA